MRWPAATLLLFAAGCDRRTDTPSLDGSAGARLERAAIGAGLVVDPASRWIVGAWASDTDRACIVPDRGGKTDRFGVLIDYGEGQGCAASGTVDREGGKLDVRLGGCRLAARFDGERIVFPAEVPPACERLCTGRASLAAMSVERQSEAISEALNLRTPSGRSLCNT